MLPADLIRSRPLSPIVAIISGILFLQFPELRVCDPVRTFFFHRSIPYSDCSRFPSFGWSVIVAGNPPAL